MKYEIDIPEDVNHLFTAQAAETGENVVALIQQAVVAFARREPAPPSVRRRPDIPLEAVEIPAPRDLPRSSPTPIPIESASTRRPDPLPEL